MNTKIIGFVLVAVAATGCASSSSDESIEPNAGACASIVPSPSDSEYQFDPSPTVTCISQEVIGMTEEEAIQTIEGVSGEEITYRVTRRDDENYAMTMDYRINRINLEIDDGIVTKTSIG